MIKRILACSDGSSYGQVCCQYAAWVAGKTGARLELLYLTDLRQFEVPLVADLSGSLGIQPYQDIITELQKIERKKAEVIEEGARRVLQEAGFTGELCFHHRTGLLVDSLGDFEEEVDLVMLGKRGENANFATEHLGSNMERMVRATKRPCLVTNRAFHPVDKAVLAYDGGPSSSKALEFLGQSALFKEMELHIVTVVEHGDRKTAETRLEEARSVAADKGAAVETHLLEGEVEDSIADFVESQGMQMLIMGAYGHSRIRRLLIGSSTTDLMRSCKVPVMCFR